MATKMRTRIPNVGVCQAQGDRLTKKLFRQQVRAFIEQIGTTLKKEYGYLISFYLGVRNNGYIKSKNWAQFEIWIDDARETAVIDITKDGITIQGPSTVPASESHKFKNIKTKKEFNEKIRIAINSVCPR